VRLELVLTLHGSAQHCQRNAVEGKSTTFGISIVGNHCQTTACTMATVDTSMTGTPWVERYRPKSLKDVSHQNEVVSTLQNAVETGRLPHLLFYGPPGSGKVRANDLICDVHETLMLMFNIDFCCACTLSTAVAPVSMASPCIGIKCQ
jgi:predicted ATPase with chaperone activity